MSDSARPHHHDARAVRRRPCWRADLADPVDFVDAVLTETRTVQRRLRDLLVGVGGVLVLALYLFPGLTATPKCGQAPRRRARSISPSGRAFGISSPPRHGALAGVFEVLAGPVALPATPGVRFGHYRTVAFDGCVSFKVPDTARNRSWLGSSRPRSAPPATR